MHATDRYWHSSLRYIAAQAHGVEYSFLTKLLWDKVDSHTGNILRAHDSTSEILIPDLGTSIDGAFPVLESCTVSMLGIQDPVSEESFQILGHL